MREIQAVTAQRVEAGRAALACGAWEEARALFEAAVSTGEIAAGLEGLSWATWWLNDAPVLFDTRERAFLLYRSSGDRRGAARMATWLGTDRVDFRGELAVAQGWLGRARRLLEGPEPSPEHGWLLVREAQDDLRRFASGGTYLNFVGDGGEDRVRAAFGEQKYQRLAASMARDDPDNVFRGNQNISRRSPRNQGDQGAAGPSPRASNARTSPGAARWIAGLV